MAAKIYFADISELKNQLDQAWALLSPDEKAKAKRFRFEADQQQCILVHGLKRKVIAEQLNQNPETLVFEKDDGGRPYLAQQGLHFNLSHSHGAILLGISHDAAIGVDIERMREATSAMELAKRYFHESECQAIERCDNEKELFYRLWVAKEAILKAQGCGIAHYLERVTLSIASEQQLSVLSLPDHFPFRESWHLEVFSPANNVLAAVALPAQIDLIEFFHSNFDEHLAFRPANG